MTDFLTETVPPAWVERALCANTDPDLFFAEKGEHDRVRAAKQVCFRCEVRPECLAYALANNDRHGVWGGLTERERRLVRKERAVSGVASDRGRIVTHVANSAAEASTTPVAAAGVPSAPFAAAAPTGSGQLPDCEHDENDNEDEDDALPLHAVDAMRQAPPRDCLEDAGEAVRTWIGVTGQTPRKGFSHSHEDVAAELADTAFAALVAIESLNGDAAAELLRCAERARRRN